ncbi:hypothetical protein FOL47_004311, partial [Perkinsus chesapeaki]
RNYTKKYGFKHYYYCSKCGKQSKINHDSSGAERLKTGVEVMLNYVNHSREVILYDTEAEHDHNAYNNRPNGLKDDVKQVILDEIHSGVLTLKPIKEKIKDMLRRQELPASSAPKNDKQIDNHLQYVKRCMNGGSGEITVGDIERMAQAYSQIPGEDEKDKAFVVRGPFLNALRKAVCLECKQLSWTI